jgi:acetolactate synthase I/II/III large subunit
MPIARTGGQILARQLACQNVQHLFCVPGESYLPVLDALLDVPIEVTVCRHEGGAAMMAEAHGKLSGRPGICFATRGPGATNAASGLHVAMQDSTPMILFVGQVARDVRGREAFQELDYRAVFGSMTKWVTEIDDARRIPEMVSRAFHVAMSGRPGPVVVALPEDVLTATEVVTDAPPVHVPEIYPGASQLDDLEIMLFAAKRPLAILGGSRWTAEAVAQFAAFAQEFDMPVACSFRRQMLFPATHPCYAGDLGFGPNPALLRYLAESDLLLVVGGRLSEVPSQGYSLLDIPAPKQRMVHVHSDANELGRVYAPELAINATPAALCESISKLHPAQPIRSQRAGQIHAELVAFSDPRRIEVPGKLQLGAIMQTLVARLPRDTIVCNGAGNFATWVHRFWPFEHYGTQLAPTSGSMGYGLPAGIAAQRTQPERPVLVVAGDGDFLMTGQEFATAVQYDLKVIVVLIDNRMYGTIRMHQERAYPGRVSGTDLRNPDFAAYAKIFGGHGERVETTDQFAPALDRALRSGKPAILHCLIDPEAISPSTTLSRLRAASSKVTA